MRFLTQILFIAASYVTLSKSQFLSSLQSSGFVSTQQKHFAPTEDSHVAAAAVNYRAQAQQGYEYEEDDDDEEDARPQNIVTESSNRRQQQQQAYIRNKVPNRKDLEEELEEEEPDRLTQLLEKSDFNCDGRTGYYADENLGCEVFHYCQENQKHSWICPEGFSFHQIHLICMPPSGENICQQSSKYHIVNDYLYKPVNLEEHESKPNITLRYSERYYPESFYQDDRQERQEYQQERQRHPLQVGIRNKPSPTQNPSAQLYRQQINTNQQHNVYRSPDDINISLQQRRPQIVFSPTTARYEDDEYNYEK